MSLKLLSTGDVAERLKADESTVRLWCRQGKFPNAQQVGRDWVIPVADVDNFTPPPMGRPKKAPTVNAAAKKSRGRPRKKPEAKP
jgi:excisionase family DNA binding protein